MRQLSKSNNKSPAKTQKIITPKNKKSSPSKYKNTQLREKYRQKFDKNIQHVVSICEQLAEMNMPQKCLQHNSNYTLYCQNDSKPLCPKCTHKNNIHSNHQIKPLQNCVQNLYKDTSKQQKQVEHIQQSIRTYRQYVSSKISNIQRQFPYAKFKIQQLFKYLHQFLFEQEKQFMKQLREYKAELVDQQNILLTEINNTQNFVYEKIRKYENKKDIDHCIIKINLSQNLKKIPKMIEEELRININENQDVFKFNSEIKQQISKFIQEKITSWVPWAKKTNQQNIKNVEKQKQLNKTPQKNKKQKKVVSKTHEKVPSQQKNLQVSNRDKSINSNIKNQTTSPDKSLKKAKQAKQTKQIKQMKQLKKIKEEVTKSTNPKIIKKQNETFDKNKIIKTQLNQKPLTKLYQPKTTIIRSVQKQQEKIKRNSHKQDSPLQKFILRTPVQIQNSKSRSKSKSKSGTKSKSKQKQKSKPELKKVEKQFVQNLRSARSIKRSKTEITNNSTKSIKIMTPSTLNHEEHNKQRVSDSKPQNQNSKLIQFLVKPVKMEQFQKPQKLSPFFKKH